MRLSSASAPSWTGCSSGLSGVSGVVDTGSLVPGWFCFTPTLNLAPASTVPWHRSHPPPDRTNVTPGSPVPATTLTRWSPRLEVIPPRADRGGADLLLNTLQTEREMAFTVV